MTEQLLLRYQRNDVFNIFKEIGINPEVFQWTKENSKFTTNIVNKLSHEQYGYYFKFDSYSGARKSVYYPTIEGKEFNEYANNWQDQLNHVKSWARVVKIELDSPDFWEISYNASRIFGPTADNDLGNEFFNIDEQNYISQKLDEIEKYLIEKDNLSAKNISFIKDSISYLDERSKHLGKKDWLNILIGVSLKIALDIALSAEAAKEFFKLVGNAFSHFWGGPILLP